MGRTRSRRCIARITLALVALAALLAPCSARAADPDSPGLQLANRVPICPLSASRTLGGHVFIPQRSVLFPFASTYVGMTLLAGSSKVDAAGLDLAGTGLPAAIDVVKLEAGLKLGLRLTDWIGLRASYRARGHTGSSLQDLVDGASIAVAHEGGGGVVGRILATERLRLAVGMRFSYFQGRLGRIGDALATGLRLALDPNDTTVERLTEMLAAGQITIAQLQRRVQQLFASSARPSNRGLNIKRTGWHVSPALTAAYAPSPHLGLQSSLSYVWTTESILTNDPSLNADVTESALEYGISASFDARQLLVPIAIPVAYRALYTFARTGSDRYVSHLVETGIYYSGREALDLGLLFLWELEPGGQRSYLGGLRLNYVW